MQKPRFRTVNKSAWLYITTRLHPAKPKKMDRRTAVRCGYLAGASNRAGKNEGGMPTPLMGEGMADYLDRFRSAAVRRG